MHSTFFISIMFVVVLLAVSPVVAGLHEDKRSLVQMRARDGNHHHHSHKKANNRIKTGAKITFYAGEQLAKPSCGGSTPKDEDMIAAAPANSPAKCGDHVTIKHGSKEVTVTVVDTCGGCPKMGLDLSKGAFQKLATLDAGVIEGAQFWIN